MGNKSIITQIQTTNNSKLKGVGKELIRNYCYY